MRKGFGTVDPALFGLARTIALPNLSLFTKYLVLRFSNATNSR